MIEELINISSFGKNLKIKHNIKSDISNKDFFIYIVNLLDALNQRYNKIEELGINLEYFEEPFLELISDLIYKLYGEIEQELIMWYVYERFDIEGNLLPLIFITDGDDEEIEEEIIVNNPLELYNLIRKIKKQK